MKLLIILVAITFACTSCKGQEKSNKQNTTTMTQELEVLDIETFKKNRVGNEYNFNNSLGNIVCQIDWGDYYSEKTTHKDSKYGVKKIFYKNGSVKEKGEFYGNIYIGNYMYINEEGIVVKKDNLNKYYTFTLEDVLEYCKENNIVDKDVLGFTKKAKVTLARTDSSNLTETDSIQWSVMYGPVPYTPKGATRVFSVVLLYVLDGKTGEEVARKYKRIKIDKEWKSRED